VLHQCIAYLIRSFFFTELRPTFQDSLRDRAGVRLCVALRPLLSQFLANTQEMDGLTVQQLVDTIYEGGADVGAAARELGRRAERADEEKQRADEEKQRADEEKRRADDLAVRLRFVNVCICVYERQMAKNMSCSRAVIHATPRFV